MMKYEKRIREIIAANLKTKIDIDDYDANGDLRNIGMNSILFVSIVVAIENEFGINFPDDKLLKLEQFYCLIKFWKVLLLIIKKCLPTF